MVTEPPKFNIPLNKKQNQPLDQPDLHEKSLNNGDTIDSTVEHIQNMGQTQDSYLPPHDPYLDSYNSIINTINTNSKLMKVAPWLLPSLANLYNSHNLSVQSLSNFFQSQPNIWQSYERISEGRVLLQGYLDIKKATAEAMEVYENLKLHAEIQHNANMLMYKKLYDEEQETLGQIYLDSVSLREYYNPAEESVIYKTQLESNRNLQKRMTREGTAVTAITNFSFNQSLKEGASFVKDFKELMLSYYNVEAENLIVKTEKTRNIETALTTIEKVFKKVKKLGAMISCSIEPDYHLLKIEEIKLAFKFKEALALEKEETALRKAEQKEAEKAELENQKELDRLEREELKIQRERQRREREIEEQKIKLQKEIEKARIEGLVKEQQRLQHVITQLDQQDKQILELEAKLASVKQAQKKTSDVLANTKAGYVYVISNKGSFGEGVVKIGLTRRVNPETRVNELGDASVPFRFSTHVIHFSENAVQLERDLHNLFKQKSVNRVNYRKEFFRVNPQEVLEAMNKLSNGTVVRFNLTPENNEYIETLRIISGENSN